MIRLAVAGASGKMGKAILGLAARDKKIKITGALDGPKSEVLGEDAAALIGSSEPLGVIVSSDASKVLKDADVLIDFTHPSVTLEYLDAAVKTKTSYVLGTTGIDAKIKSALAKAAKKISIVQSFNMSIGVNLLFKLTQMTAAALDEGYDIEISEIHHRMKKDSPSGTAVRLLELAAEARGKDLKKDVVYGREGEVGARPRGEIGVMALRGGDVIGDHTVYFLAEGERIELSHRATSRNTFAGGAIHAAKFLAKKKTGLFNMQQVLGIA